MRRITLVVVVLALLTSSAAAWAAVHGSGQKTSRAQGTAGQPLATTLLQARLATTKYATSLAAAKADGYRIITKMIPNMGYHFMNPKVTGFDPTKPAILVYEKTGGHWQLGALEWVFPAKPKTPPLPGARYGGFPAACHYTDGTFVPAASQDACAKTAPGSSAAFSFWPTNLVTLHVWAWYPNPAGLYSGLNPLVAAFDAS